MSVEIEVLAEITDEVLEAFGRLLPQLPSSARPIDGAGASSAGVVRGPTRAVRCRMRQVTSLSLPNTRSPA